MESPEEFNKRFRSAFDKLIADQMAKARRNGGLSIMCSRFHPEDGYKYAEMKKSDCPTCAVVAGMK